jgi:hypothetical protein
MYMYSTALIFALYLMIVQKSFPFPPDFHVGSFALYALAACHLTYNFYKSVNY